MKTVRLTMAQALVRYLTAQKIVIEKVEVNIPVDDDSFHFPATAAKPAAAK